MKELPIACELTPAELEARRVGLLPGLLAQATERVPLSNGFRWRFAPSTEVLMTAVKTIDAERQCCRFLKLYDDRPDGVSVARSYALRHAGISFTASKL